MSSLRDKIWLLGETPGSHHAVKHYNLPGVNKMTPLEGLEFYGVKNLCRMKMSSDGDMSYVTDKLIQDDKGVMDKLSLSLLGAGGRGAEGDNSTMNEIIEVAKRDKRLVSAINDDFFCGNRPEIFTPDVLAHQREQLHTAIDRPIEFWSVVYDRSVITNENVYAHAKEYDLTTFWIWYSSNIPNLPAYIEWARSLTKEGRVILGLYMWDYGTGSPISDDFMKFQLDVAYERLVSGKIEGIMLHSSNNSDIGLESTQIVKGWLENIDGDPIFCNTKRDLSFIY